MVSGSWIFCAGESVVIETMSREEVLAVFHRLQAGDYIYSSGYCVAPEDNFAFIARVVESNSFTGFTYEVRLLDIWAVDGTLDDTWWLSKDLVQVYKIFRVI